ncbi:MAG: hypothetical protein ACOCUV_03170 [bacterium]
MSKRPYYNFNDFKTACSSGANVIPINTVLDDANKDFNLKTKKELLNFIANNGLEELSHINQTPLRKTNIPHDIIVDAYHFKTLDRLGYIAFFQNHKMQWIIKSFHISDRASTPFKIAFKNAGIEIDQFNLKGDNNED